MKVANHNNGNISDKEEVSSLKVTNYNNGYISDKEEFKRFRS